MALNYYRVSRDMAILGGMKPVLHPIFRSLCPTLTFGLLCLMSGCAGTNVQHEQLADVPFEISQPHSITISVTDKSPLPRRKRRIANHLRDVETAERELAHDLTQMFAARHLTVVSSGKIADLNLQCAVTRVRSGSLIARLLVGYGAGKAVLDTNTTISTTTDHPEVLLTFGTNGTTGSMPGAGIGVMSAAGAAGTAVHMIGPLLGVPGTLRQGLVQEVQQTATRVDDEMAKLFKKHAWSYPQPPRSFLDRL